MGFMRMLAKMYSERRLVMTLGNNSRSCRSAGLFVLYVKGRVGGGRNSLANGRDA